MKNRRRIWIGVLFLTMMLSQAACGSITGTRGPEIPLSTTTVAYETFPTSTLDQKIDSSPAFLLAQPEEIARIRQATVMIRMQAPQNQNVVGMEVSLGQGIGSLIQIKGEILLVTHNHWGEMLQDLTIVELRNADNQMIKPIYGYQFKELILSQDAGTLILRPPQELIDQLAPISMDAIPQIAAGETVVVVLRENPAREKATIQQAVVEEIFTHEGLPAYRLRSLNGQPIKPGDSGGGIWFNCALVGNNWVTLVETSVSAAETSENLEEENIVYTDLSYAAILSLEVP